jgi:hypothetical protein
MKPRQAHQFVRLDRHFRSLANSWSARNSEAQTLAFRAMCIRKLSLVLRSVEMEA